MSTKYKYICAECQKVYAEEVAKANNMNCSSCKGKLEERSNQK